MPLVNNGNVGVSSLGLVNQNTGGGAALQSIDASGKGFLVGGPVGAVAAGVMSLIASFAQHTQRLRDAKNENAALDQLIPAFDADIQVVAQAFNQGASPQDCINALIAIDTNAYNYLRAQLGKPNTPGLPGVAWGGPSSQSIGYNINPSYPATCNMNCTAGCCVYLNDLRPAIFGRQVGSAYGPYQNAPGIVGGMIEAIQKGGGTVHVIPVASPPNKNYGNYQRASYDITLKAPPAGTNVSDIALSSSGSGTGFAITATGAPATPAQGAASSLVPFTQSLAKISPVTLLAVVGGLIIVITALFGQNALRVDQ